MRMKAEFNIINLKQVGLRILKKLSWFSENFETIVSKPLSGEFKEAYKLRFD